MNQDEKKLQAEMLMRLVEEHKAKCEGRCFISVFLLGKLYQELIGRKLNKKEIKVFM